MERSLIASDELILPSALSSVDVIDDLQSNTVPKQSQLNTQRERELESIEILDNTKKIIRIGIRIFVYHTKTIKKQNLRYLMKRHYGGWGG